MSIRSSLQKSLKQFERRLITYNNITLSRSALLHNFDIFQGLNSKGSVFPVLKANAYGHGLLEITNILRERSFPYIAVDGYYEAIRIHEVSKKRVLVMGAIDPRNFRIMSFRRIALVVHDEHTVTALAKTNRAVTVHIELETGMGRHGVTMTTLPAFLKLLKGYPKLRIEGVMTHLSDADNPADSSYTNQQVAVFDKAVETILASGFKPTYFHIGQSAGSTKVVSKYANATRVGIGLYGVSPLEPNDKAAKKLRELRPVLTLTSTIAKVLDEPAGSSISYARTYTTKQASRIGVLPLGYYEGLPRALSSVGIVKWKVQYLPIVGRVCMNHTMIDLTGSKAKWGDTVTVISSTTADKNSVIKICKPNKLFTYNLLTGLNENIRRTIVA